MRIDHFAYQQGTRVATFGFALQGLIGLVLLFLSRWGATNDTALQFASYYVFVGLIAWLSLIVVFHQHRLERLEALEADELLALRHAAESVFDSEGAGLDVAARRLRLMHRWMMPIISVVIALLMGGLCFRIFRWFDNLNDPNLDIAPFGVTSNRGWALAICLGLSMVAFIFARFVAGMAKQEAWQNLRGGGGYMVGNALVMLAVAIGVGFTFFEKMAVIEYVAKGIAIFMAVMAIEIVFNFVLNLYRPRRPGEVPRPAFDSKTLSYFAAPDSIVRSINEAVNYQFGFDITSSWGYQLLLRSVAWLVGLAVVIMFLLSAVVIVQPGQEAIRLRGGRIVGERVYDSGLLLKLPWPFESVHAVDVASIRSLPLGAERTHRRKIQMWSDDLRTDLDINPFIVRPSLRRAEDRGGAGILPVSLPAGAGAESDAEKSVSDEFAVVNWEIHLQYRVKDGGLMDFVRFSSEDVARRQHYTVRERALRSIALREASRILVDQPLDAVLAWGRQEIASQMKVAIQAAFDREATGVEVVAVVFPIARPPKDAAGEFEERSVASHTRRELVLDAEGRVTQGLSLQIGDNTKAARVYDAIVRFEELEREFGAEHADSIDARVEAEGLLLAAGGEAATVLAMAEAGRWQTHMEARIQATQALGELPAFRAAPELYRERRIMTAVAQALQQRKKYILGLPSERVQLDIDLKQQDFGLSALEGAGVEAGN